MQVGELKVGAAAVVNAFGDVFDPRTGQKIAGMLNPQRTAFVSGEDASAGNSWLRRGPIPPWGPVFTNGAFDQAAMNKIASMARAAFGRCIRPSGTMIDGDTIYAFSVGEQVEADINVVGTLAATVLSEAIRDSSD